MLYFFNTHAGGLSKPNVYEPIKTIQDIWDWIMGQKIGDFIGIFFVFNIIPIIIWICLKVKKHKSIYKTLENTEKIIESISKKENEESKKIDFTEITEKEIALLQAYNAQPEMQDAIDRLLNVKKPEQPTETTKEE